MNPQSPRVAERLGVAFVAGAVLAVFAFAGPIAQPQDYHRFADARVLSAGPFALPHAADVLTSLAFVAAGIAGLACDMRALPSQAVPLRVFFGGLVLAGGGSVWYHLSPSDASLVWDRLGMAPAFAGAIGALAAERLGAAAGRRWLVLWLALGIASVTLWALGGDLRLYVIAQFGGLGVLLLWFRLATVAGMVRLPWGWLLFAYVLAKGFELADRPIWLLTDGLISGHPLKHLVAALGVLPLLRALRRE